MELHYVDTNVFLRFLTVDIPEKARAAERLFTKAVNGEIKLITSEVTIAELVWTLEKYYKLSRYHIREIIEGILSTSNLEITNSDMIQAAIEIYESQNVDYIDGYTIAFMRQTGVKKIFSFDRKHFQRFRDISCLSLS